MKFDPFPMTLDNGKTVPVIKVPPKSKLDGIKDALGLKYIEGSVAVVGGAAHFDGQDYAPVRERVRQLLQAIADQSLKKGLALVDGGTPFGVMKLVGEVCARNQNRFPLIGVAPSGKVLWKNDRGMDYTGTWHAEGKTTQADRAPLDPNHTGFVLVESDEWGGEVDMLAEVAHQLAGKYRAVEILVNGGTVAPLDVLAFIKRGGDVLVMEGSGRFADELAQGLRGGIPRSEQIREIVASGRAHLTSVSDPPMVFLRKLEQLAQPR